MSNRKTYTPAFRRRAIQTVYSQPESSITAIARTLGIPEGTLYNWLHEERRKQFSSDDPTAAEHHELLELRRQTQNQAKEIARLKEANEILEKAEAFFAEQDETR